MTISHTVKFIQQNLIFLSVGSDVCGRSHATAIPWHVGIYRYHVCHHWYIYTIYSRYIFYVARSGLDFMLYANNHHYCIVFCARESVLAADQRPYRTGERIVVLVITARLPP